MAGEFWEDAAQRDPLWAILSDPTKRGRQWDLGEFFETGRREISLLLYQLRQLGHPPSAGRALDFGCGVGRLTQALAATFAEVVGVDVSPTMIRLARELNRYPAVARYVLNQSASLAQFPSGSFDFVYSDIVLQHLDPEHAKQYIAEFLRVLRRGGAAVFQLPSHRRMASGEAARPVSMPAQAYRADLRVVEGLPRSLRAGDAAAVTVEIRNAAPVAWDQTIAGSVRLGNHWRNAAGDMLIQDDGRTRLPSLCSPAQTLRLLLAVKAPPDPGRFVCEFDLVHEGVSWFGDRGSPTARSPVVVTAATHPLAREADDETDVPAPARRDDFPDIYSTLRPTGPDEIGPFPMHGIARETVVELVRRHGGEPFSVEDDERGGPEWQGYRYYVSKAREVG